MLDQAGIEHVICESGPTGGRHVWTALAESVDAETVATLARLARHVCPSLDLSPLSNAATGCVRPPGAPHRAGGRSTVLSGVLVALTSPTGTAEQVRRLVEALAQLVDDAMVRVEREGEDDLRIAVDGGFLSVTEEAVRILVENAEFESEINADSAKQDSESDDPPTAAWGPARLRALGQLD